MTDYQRVYNVVQDVMPTAIVIHCSDPRFQEAFGQFIEGELGLGKGQFVPIVVDGGAGVLARPQSLPKEFKFIKDRINLFLEHLRSIRRIVLINHQDCKYYDGLSERVMGLLAKFSKQDRPGEDLKDIAKVLGGLLSYAGVGVELYYAKFADEEHTKVVFEKMEKTGR